MVSWSQKRKLMYATIASAFLIGIIGLPLFYFFYKAPTCFDSKRNGGEQGIDCGGRCSRLCQSDFLPPNVVWARQEKITSEYYNVAAYIINPNTQGQADNVPYSMALFDKDGAFITEIKGMITLPPHRNILAFQNAVKVGNKIPSRALFEFTALPNWYKKADPLSNLSVVSKDYSEDSTGSSLLVTFKNNGLQSLNKVNVYVVLYDKSGNAIGFSKTIIDEILSNGTATAPFTWNINRQDRVISIEVLYMTE